MDKITDFAKTLVGGEGISSNTVGAAAMMSKAHGALSGVQKRGMGMLKKNVAPAAMKGAGAIRQGISDMASRGQGVSRAPSGTSSPESGSRDGSSSSPSGVSSRTVKDDNPSAPT